MNRMYKIVIKSIGFYIGKLKANTFFGAFCCAYKDIYGEDELIHFLHKVSDGKHELTFSSAFNAGYIPQRIDKGSGLLVKVDTFGSDIEDVVSKEPNNYVSGKCKLGETNELFTVESSYYKENLEGYLVTSLSKEIVNKVISLAMSNGLGGRKSTGNGNFELVDIQEASFNAEGKNGFIVLSDFIPDRDTPMAYELKTTIREAINTQGRKQKDLMLIQEGSVFKESGDIKKTYGTVVYDKESNSYINCKAIAFPIIV